jgi:small GTP-binding protein
MLKRILDETRHALLQEEGRLLGDPRVALVRLHASEENQRTLARSIAQLDELFLLVVVGEFNTGKSSVINAMLGEQVLQEGVTPTTSRIGLLRHGPAAAGPTPAGSGSEAITLPLELLREITIVDTPGTNAVLRDHETLTRDFVPRADLVLFVTSADRPFTESERAFLEAIQSWGKKVMLAVNKVDILETPEDVNAVVDFVKEQALALLGLRPRVFAVSARQARRGKAEGNEALLRASGFLELESFVTHTLNEAVRLRLKLLNPLGVGLRIAGESLSLAEERLTLLRDDSAVLDAVEAQLGHGREELGRELQLRVTEVEKALADQEQRNADSLDQALRLRNLPDLTGRDLTLARLEREVVGDPSHLLDKRSGEIVSWLVTRQRAQWRSISERVQARQASHGEGMAGLSVGTVVHEDVRLLQDVRRDIQRALENASPRGDVRRLARTARTAAIAAIVLQPVALVVAALAIVLAPPGGPRIAGLVLAVLLALVGLALIPTLRARAARRLRHATRGLHAALVARLKASLDRELEQDRRLASDALHPYRDFVRTETERSRAQRDQLRSLQGGLEALRDRIQSL